VFLAFWFVIAQLGLVNALLVPSPLRVLQSIDDVGMRLLAHIGATIARVCIGFALGMMLGTGVGVVMQFDSRVFRILDGLVETFRPVPPVAVIPFFLLLFGFAEVGKILITVLGVGLLCIVTTVEAMERVPATVIRWGLVAGLPKRELFRRVIIPAAWPEMRGGVRIAMALAITLVIVSEFMGATYGLGYLISVSKVTLTTPTILLSTMLLGWIGWGFDRLIRFIFDVTTAWDIRAKGAVR
jgi:ABC-type nitrate/sulfonate/bicarbonate transport system permease component